jgi:hypothetical protein
VNLATAISCLTIKPAHLAAKMAARDFHPRNPPSVFYECALSFHVSMNIGGERRREESLSRAAADRATQAGFSSVLNSLSMALT